MVWREGRLTCSFLESISGVGDEGAALGMGGAQRHTARSGESPRSARRVRRIEKIPVPL